MPDVDLRAEVLGPWTHPTTSARTPSRFMVGWDQCLTDLEREARLIGAKEVVVALDVRARDIGRSGWLLSGHRMPEFPGVRVTIPSRHGTLVYACDNYRYGGTMYLKDWQANIRSVSLTLEALRGIDRWGAARHGEQYAGFRAIGAGATALPGRRGQDPAESAAWLAEQASVVGYDITGQMLRDDADLRRSVRRDLVKITHPDTGGDAGQFDRIERAFESLEAP